MLTLDKTLFDKVMVNLLVLKQKRRTSVLCNSSNDLFDENFRKLHYEISKANSKLLHLLQNVRFNYVKSSNGKGDNYMFYNLHDPLNYLI